MPAAGPSAVVDRSRAPPFETHAPLHDLRAAAGAFGPERPVGAAGDEIGWVPVPRSVRLTRDHFVARVEGRSMVPTIRDGAWCLLRADRGGSREGKTVLVSSPRVPMANPAALPRLPRSCRTECFPVGRFSLSVHNQQPDRDCGAERV